MKFKEITISGTPYERGLAYGQQCKEEIGISIAVYTMLFDGLKGIAWENARKIAQRYLDLTRDFEADYAEEMRGIADGANVDILDIAALNARTEIMFSKPEGADAQECTTLSLLPPATKDGRVIAAQNWDFSALLCPCIVIVHYRQEEKPNFMMVAEAGMIGGIGMNDCGIAVMLNALRATAPCQGIPLRARMRAMLEAENLNNAYVRGSHAPVSVANLIATHKDGVAIAFEMDSETVEPMIPEGGALLHTNHYLGPKMYLAHDCNHMGSSYIRLQRVRALVNAHHGEITVETVKDILCDHAGYPRAICTHEYMKDAPVMRDATNFAIIMDLTDNCIYLAPGNPCENAFEKYDV